ncbi:MAG: ribosome assembly factor SBDS [Candidatus Ranarchaeia archaeon]
MRGAGAIRGEKRVGIDKAAVVRYEVGHERFEILVDPNLAWEYRQGKDIPVNDIVMGFVVFENALKGKRASETSIQSVFETVDEVQVVTEILKKGRINLTAEQRKKRIEQKKKQIITIISRNAINPQTGYPHPPDRIERAMDDAKVSIDPFKAAEEQVKEIVKALTPLLPIRMERVKIALKIPPDSTGQAFGIVSRYGQIVQDQWQKDGSWIAVVETSAGLQMAMIDELNKLTKGRLETKVIDRKI